jgi:hypothetical protein
MFKTLLIVLVVAVLLEDGMSVKKRTREEEEEDERVAKEVNATLAAEEAEKKKEEEDKKKREEKKKATDEVKDQKNVEPKEGSRDKDEALPCYNLTCPIIEPCQPCKPCEDCPACKESGPCPTVKPCKPCSVVNHTNGHQDFPSPPSCPEVASSMSVPVAMLVGACASLLVTGVATVIGLLLRYVPPTVSGLLFLAIIIIIWYLSSQYPATARELGGRAVALLREATVALGHRLMEALRHQEQVSFSCQSYPSYSLI